MKKIISKIHGFIFSKRIKEIQDIKDKIDWIASRQEYIMNHFLVGVDVHLKHDSWAVVCIKGKSDYINFFRLRDAQVREIQIFLRQFNKENACIDIPYIARDIHL